MENHVQSSPETEHFQGPVPKGLVILPDVAISEKPKWSPSWPTLKFCRNNVRPQSASSRDVFKKILFEHMKILVILLNFTYVWPQLLNASLPFLQNKSHTMFLKARHAHRCRLYIYIYTSLICLPTAYIYYDGRRGDGLARDQRVHPKIFTLRQAQDLLCTAPSPSSPMINIHLTP